MMVETARQAEAWVDQPEISARSVLVTILGDLIRPATNSVWLSDLIALTKPFGFNDRLVRTSVFRLVSDGWLTNKRVGRQSRYALTPLADVEFGAAERRIYQWRQKEWSQDWVMVLTDGPLTTPNDRDRLIDHLRWRGFVALGRGVMASPTANIDDIHQALELLDMTSPVPVAQGKIGPTQQLVDVGYFASVFNTKETEDRYIRFGQTYTDVLEQLESPSGLLKVTSVDAFVLRTMLVHDFRRIRLDTPDIPDELLPPGWQGRNAYLAAAAIYHKLYALSLTGLSKLAPIPSPPDNNLVKERFPTPTKPGWSS